MGFESNSISIPFHWSGGILAITIVVSIILVGTGFYIASLNWPTVMLWLKYLLIIVFFIAIIVGVGYMPIPLKADNGKIMVKNLFGSPQILLSEVVEVVRISKSDINGSIKTFGSDGFFGYIGRFRNNKLGNYSMYVTDMNNLILVRTGNKKYVFSCSRPQEFVEFVNLQLKR